LESVASEIQRTWGSLDVLVNNAGIWLEGDLSKNFPQDISQLISINLTGVILATRAFTELLCRGNFPQIVNVGSLAALEPCPGWPVYAAAKYGLKGFSDSISLNYADRGIRVTLVNPGGIDTQLYVSAGYPETIHQPWMMEVAVVAETIAKLIRSEADGSRVSQLDIRRFG
jgi:NAD(P)-dependent dehydrogenase (short-subunit alcohol dehydrogenase family)